MKGEQTSHELLNAAFKHGTVLLMRSVVAAHPPFQGGAGWHYFITEANAHAGVHATCEALNLILSFPDQFPTTVISKAVEQSYTRFLLPVFKGALTESAEPQCEQAIRTTTKISKFLQLSQKVRQLSDSLVCNETEKRLAQLLESAHQDHTWGHRIPATVAKSNLIATASVVNAVESASPLFSREFIAGLRLKVVQLLTSWTQMDTSRLPFKQKTNTNLPLFHLAAENAALRNLLGVSVINQVVGDLWVDGTVMGQAVYSDSFPGFPGGFDAVEYSVECRFIRTVLALTSSGKLPKQFVALVLPNLVRLAEQSLGWQDLSETSFPFVVELLTCIGECITDPTLMAILPSTLPMDINPILFHPHRFTIRPRSAFLAMPFKLDWSLRVSQALKIACEAKQIALKRVDDDKRPNDIMQGIWRDLNESEFIVADCTSKNPNVYYEMGIAHALGKPVFMCAQARGDFTFDIKGINQTIYSLDDLPDLQVKLGEFITHITN